MMNFAMTGGCILHNRKLSDCEDPRFIKVVELLRDADVSFAHLEGTIAGANDPEVYPSAEAGWTWIRNPIDFVKELKWAGFDLVSHASNHSLDYMYGGLYSTWAALRNEDFPFAGTGMTLAEARQSAILKNNKGSVALISSSSSTANWARAADPVKKDSGRPGVNQIRLIRLIDEMTANQIRLMAKRLGFWMVEIDDDIIISPPGLHNTITHYRVSKDISDTIMPDPEDIQANLEAIQQAKKKSKFVIFHIHNHEWEPDSGLSSPPKFIRNLAHQCIDAGADIFIAEGAHALIRGIEIYKGKAIFYDPGDLFKDGNSKTRSITEYYWVQGINKANGKSELTPFNSRSHQDFNRLPPATNPPGGYSSGKVLAVFIPICSFDENGKLSKISIYPARHLKDSEDNKGLPGIETGQEAELIISYLQELSTPFGTKINLIDGIGVINL